ncbi:histone-like nucleoid-structuring protein Lsr2 [Streptomyces misionensis]|uniref:histone-like nucleoid-structuring protein Lsr2 n=1 Tax=Streptomyces misionensis TaxID=67331 RepID=UPI0036BCF331
MAQKVQVLLVDDLDGGEAQGTVIFALDGRSYEIDLNEANEDRLRELLAPYIKAGRRVSNSGQKAGRGAAGRGAAASSGSDTGQIREWARRNGYEVNDRGRVPAIVREAYEKANA